MPGGTYWSWDPKETWSLIVWFVYAAFLHARITKGWVGKRAAWLSIIGFAATIFCYLGVNLFLLHPAIAVAATRLHSYPEEVTVVKNSFWKGSRGEWYLVVQAGLFLLLIFGPQKCQYLADWRSPFTWIGSLMGVFLILVGTLLATYAAINLGRNLTPLPVPKENATMIITGAYRFVRHPIYSGVIFMAIGWGLWRHSWLTIGYVLLLFIFFDIKSRLEERLLAEKFPEYTDYRKRVRKLIPFVY